MQLPSALSRRSFLRLTAFSTAMLALSRLRVAPALAAAPMAEAAGTLRVLSASDAAILTAIAECIVDTGDPSMPALRDTAAIETIDTSLLYLDADVRQQLHWALLLFEYGPILFDFRFSRFTGLDPSQRDAHLRGWEESRFLTRRLAFRAVKNLSLLGYYSQDATWKGIHYAGPWVPRPRRPVPA
jgi:hypothetical protein